LKQNANVEFTTNDKYTIDEDVEYISGIQGKLEEFLRGVDVNWHEYSNEWVKHQVTKLMPFDNLNVNSPPKIQQMLYKSP
jgi:hypothetical protein